MQTLNLKKHLDSLLQKAREHHQLLTQCGLGLYLGTLAVQAHASFIAPKICSAFKMVAGNDLYSLMMGVGGLGIGTAWVMDDGQNGTKTALLRIGTAGAVLLNLETITTAFTGSGWGC